jgi:hypothetical protein
MTHMIFIGKLKTGAPLGVITWRPVTMISVATVRFYALQKFQFTKN